MSLKKIICVSSIVLLGACSKKHHDKDKDKASPPPSAPAPTEQKSPPERSTGGGDPSTGAPQKSGQQGKQAGTQPERLAERSNPTVILPLPPRAELPKPAESSPSIPSDNVAKLEQDLPEVSPLDTFGGQLITGYLRNEMTGEQVIAQTFDNNDLIMSNLAEMSVALRALGQQGSYSQNDQEKVLVLEGAMTQYMNEKLASERDFARTLEYGTAVALGLVGGYYSNEIINALQKVGASAAVQKPLQGMASGFQWVKDGVRSTSNWVAARWPFGGSSGIRGTQAPDGTVARKSQDLYRRTVGFINSPSNAADRASAVYQNIYRVINSPQLAKGYKVAPVADDELAAVKRLTYYPTGIPGFRINQVRGNDYLTAQLVTRGGELEFFKVTGNGIKAVTKNGEEMVVPPEQMASLISSRLRGWGERTSSVIAATGTKVKDGVTTSRPYQYVTTDPFARRMAQGAAVGVPISVLTLLALRPIDGEYLTVDEYLRDLESEGIHLNRFIDERRQGVAGRM